MSNPQTKHLHQHPVLKLFLELRQNSACKFLKPVMLCISCLLQSLALPNNSTLKVANSCALYLNSCSPGSINPPLLKLNPSPLQIGDLNVDWPETVSSNMQNNVRKSIASRSDQALEETDVRCTDLVSCSTFVKSLFSENI